MCHSAASPTPANHQTLKSLRASPFIQKRDQVENDLHFEADWEGPQFSPLALQTPPGQTPLSPSPLGSGVLPLGPPTRRGRLQLRRCDSRQSLGLEPFVYPQLGGSRRLRCPPPAPLPERSPEGIQPWSRSEVRNESVGERKRVRGASLRDPPVKRAALTPPAAARARLSGSGLSGKRARPCLPPGPISRALRRVFPVG